MPDLSNPLDPLSYNADTYAIDLKNLNTHNLGVSTADSFSAVWTGSSAVLLYSPDGTNLNALACDEDGNITVSPANLLTATTAIGRIKLSAGGKNVGLTVYDGGDIIFALIDDNLNILSTYTVSSSGASSYHEMSEPVFMGTDRWALAYTDLARDVKMILLDTSSSSASVLDSVTVYSGAVTSMSTGGLAMQGDGSGSAMLLIADDDGSSATVLNGVFLSLLSDSLSYGSAEAYTATISGIGAVPLVNVSSGNYLFLSTDLVDIQGLLVSATGLEWSKNWGLGAVTVYNLNAEDDAFSILYDDGTSSLILVRKDSSLSSSMTDSPYTLYSYTNGIEAAIADTGEKYLVFYADTDGVTPAAIYCLE